MTPQTATVLRLLERDGVISAHDLCFVFGITRTGARIWDLRRLGYKIRTLPMRRLPNGEHTMARYELLP